jgi:hypothetical protein
MSVRRLLSKHTSPRPICADQLHPRTRKGIRNFRNLHFRVQISRSGRVEMKDKNVANGDVAMAKKG